MIIWEVLIIVLFIGLIVLFFVLPRRKREERSEDPQREAYTSEEP